MSIPLEVLAAEVLGLPAEERALLLDRLVESLEVTPLDPAWETEIERRLAEYDRGEVQAIDAEEVFAKARRLAR